MGAVCCKDQNAVSPGAAGAGSPRGVHRSRGSNANLFSVLGIDGLQEGGVKGANDAIGGANGGAGAWGKSSLGVEQRGQPALIDESSAVKVAVLVRPLLDFEGARGAVDIVQTPGPARIRLPSKPQPLGPVPQDADGGYTFDYDAVYRMQNDAVSREMFQTLCLRVTERFCQVQLPAMKGMYEELHASGTILQGFNGAILAYGQTGSGKTYTMGTSGSMRDALSKKGASGGVLPRLITTLFSYVQAASAKYDITTRVSFVEIYNEQIRDLLRSEQTKGDANRLEVRENEHGEVVIEGVTEVVIKTPSDMAAAMDAGSALRAVGAHKMNEQSSRSHAIVTVLMEQRAKVSAVKEVPPELRYLRSRLHLVDLAGSERQKDTGAEGQRFQEGVNINKGLLELGNVINALTEGTRRKHVPYRNSKLTRVLQDSLGGNAETLMLACVSPADVNHEQTLNTLRYAQRARAIRNTLRLNNEQTPEEEIAYLRALVTQLQAENAELKGRVAQLGG